MEPDLHSLLKENNELLKEQLELTRESHKRIKNMHSNMRRSFYARIIYWIFIILITAGAFYAFKPKIDGFFKQYQSIMGQFEATKGLVDDPTSFIEESLAPSGMKIFNLFLNDKATEEDTTVAQ